MLPGAFNALTAMQIERAGFDAVYVSGAGIAAARGLPDIGLLSMTEVVADAGAIARSVAIPALADADTGYGPPLSVMRTVEVFEQAGLAGLHLEDQESPKKCGHLPDKRLVAVAEMAQKVGAAAQARRDRDFLIVARTDARAVEGLDGAVKRARAYVNAGADAIFPEALGYRLVLFPVTALRVATQAIEAMLEELRSLGTQQRSLDKMQTRQRLYELLRYAEYEKWDDDIEKRYGR